MPELAVLIPAHNAESTIGHAIRSAQLALPRDSVISVYDDASIDQTSAVVQSLAEDDHRIVLFAGGESVGSGAARQELVRRTDSRYIANLDADDVWLPWHIRSALRGLRVHDAYFSAAVRFWTGRPNIRPTRLRSLTPHEVRCALLIHNPLVHSSLVARRESIESAGGYSGMRRWQDYEFWLRLAMTASIVKSGTVSVGYRQSVGQVSRSSGYVGALDRDDRIAAAYGQLFDEVLPSGEHDAQPASWSTLWKELRPVNQRYYRKLQKSVRHPLTEATRATDRGVPARRLADG